MGGGKWTELVLFGCAELLLEWTEIVLYFEYIV